MVDAYTLETCTCTLPMRRTANGLLYCENCDRPQTQEQTLQPNGKPGLRKPTVADRRFNLNWAAKMREIYPHNHG